MTNEDIIRMAREAGLGWDEKYHWYVSGEQLKCFARLVYEATFRDANIAASKTILDAAVLEEREACAKVCEDEAEKWEGDDGPISTEARLCAINIRARGEKT